MRDIFKNLEIGQNFAERIDNNGTITYQKIKTTHAKIVGTSGKYQPHLIGNVKIFYGQNVIFKQ